MKHDRDDNDDNYVTANPLIRYSRALACIIHFREWAKEIQRDYKYAAESINERARGSRNLGGRGYRQTWAKLRQVDWLIRASANEFSIIPSSIISRGWLRALYIFNCAREGELISGETKVWDVEWAGLRMFAAV